MPAQPASGITTTVSAVTLARARLERIATAGDPYRASAVHSLAAAAHSGIVFGRRQREAAAGRAPGTRARIGRAPRC